MGKGFRCIPATYFFGFNIVYTAIGLILTGLAIYLMIREDTKLNRAFLICSIIYLIISLWGLKFRRGYSGSQPGACYLVFFTILTLFQIAVFVAFTFFPSQATKQLTSLDAGANHRLSSFLLQNMEAFRTLLGVGAAAQLLNFFSGILISKSPPVLDSRS